MGGFFQGGELDDEESLEAWAEAQVQVMEEEEEEEDVVVPVRHKCVHLN